MKPIDLKTAKLGQDEARTLIAQLGLHAANLRGLLAASEAETLHPPKLNGDEYAQIELLTAHVNELEHRLGDAAPKFQFSTALRPGGAAAPGSGLRESTTNPGAASKSAAKVNATAQVLAAKGCTTIAELTAKHIAGLNAGKPIVGD